MMNLTEIDNAVLKHQLSRSFGKKVRLGFGLDVSEIKGVKDFPVYDVTKGYTSNAKKNTDSYLFNSTNKYDIKKGSHTSIGSMNPNYLYHDVKLPTPKRTNFRMRTGEMSELYGIPPDRTIILENPTAQAMNMMGGQMTEKKMRDHIWREEASVVNFLNSPQMASILGASPPASRSSSPTRSPSPSHGSASATTPSPTTPVKKSKTAPVVSQAFPTETTPVETTPVETTPKKTSLSLKDALGNLLGNSDVSQRIDDSDRSKLDQLLRDNGFKRPKKSVKKISSYILAFNSIIDGEIPSTEKKTPKKVDWNEALERSKKTPDTKSKLKIPKNFMRLLDEEIAKDTPIKSPTKSPKTKRTPTKETVMFFEKEG